MGSQIFIRAKVLHSPSLFLKVLKAKVQLPGEFMRKYQALGRFFWIPFCKK